MPAADILETRRTRGVLERLDDIYNAKEFGAVGDGINDDTDAIQFAITQAKNNGGGEVVLPPGDYVINSSLVINSSGITLRGIAGPSPGYGTVVSAGSRILYTATTGDAITIDARNVSNGMGIATKLLDLTIVGNLSIPGAVSGGGISLIADTAGESQFIQNCEFRNVTVRQSKGNAWTVTGTVFLNNWHNCTGIYCGGNALEIDPGVAGLPVQNVFTECLFSDAAGWAVLLKSGNRKETFYGCEIAQSTNGGLSQTSGYTTITDCDFEANVGPAISLTASSASTNITGGMIHKSPSGSARVGIQVNAGCAGSRIQNVLFANYDNVNDRIIAFAGGGTVDVFDYRVQNTIAAAFPTASWNNIARIPSKEKTIVGTVTFAGTGIGVRSQTITFSTAFEVSYTIVLVANVAGGVEPLKAVPAIDYSTQNLGNITAKLSVNDAGYGSISAQYIAIGR